MKKLYIFDLDYTLFETDVKVALYTNGEFERYFESSKEYHDHSKIKGDHHFYDYAQYVSSQTFKEQARPIHHVLDDAKRAIEDSDTDVVLLTARNIMDDMNLFKEVFKEHGLNPDKIKFEFSGELRDLHGRNNLSAARAKQVIIESYLHDKSYDLVKMYDDLSDNLDAFLQLDDEFPDTKFIAYQVL